MKCSLQNMVAKNKHVNLHLLKYNWTVLFAKTRAILGGFGLPFF